MAALVTPLFERQKIRLLGFDVVFAEADESSGLAQLQRLARQQLRDQPGFSKAVQQLRGRLRCSGAIGGGLSLARALLRLSALRAVGLGVGVLGLVVGLSTAMYLGYGLVRPLAAAMWR